MNDEEFINYCETHCTTQRALFNGEQLTRILDLGKVPFKHDVKDDEWVTCKESPMLAWVETARKELRASKNAT